MRSHHVPKDPKVPGMVKWWAVTLFLLVAFCFRAEQGMSADQTINAPFVGDVIGDDNSAPGSSGGSNTLTVTGSGSVTGDVIGSNNSGDNSSGNGNIISNAGTVDGAISGSRNWAASSSGGSNTVTNSGTTNDWIEGSWNSGQNSSGGANTVSNSGDVFEIYGSFNDGTGSSGGSNTVNNSGDTAFLSPAVLMMATTAPAVQIPSATRVLPMKLLVVGMRVPIAAAVRILLRIPARGLSLLLAVQILLLTVQAAPTPSATPVQLM